MPDLVRVLRIVEYVGPRPVVEAQIRRSLHGTRELDNGLRISAATIGTYPEILTSAHVPETETFWAGGPPDKEKEKD